MVWLTVGAADVVAIDPAGTVLASNGLELDVDLDEAVEVFMAEDFLTCTIGLDEFAITVSLFTVFSFGRNRSSSALRFWIDGFVLEGGLGASPVICASKSEILKR